MRVFIFWACDVRYFSPAFEIVRARDMENKVDKVTWLMRARDLCEIYEFAVIPQCARTEK